MSDKTTVFEYMRRQSERTKKLGRVRTGETYQQTLYSFMRFRNGVDLDFDRLDADMVEQYESYMRSKCLSRNTTSFYMRILRCIYNRAVEERLAQQILPFRRVYTGVDKTAKRAITIKEIRRIKELELTDKPDLVYVLFFTCAVCHLSIWPICARKTLRTATSPISAKRPDSSLRFAGSGRCRRLSISTPKIRHSICCQSSQGRTVWNANNIPTKTDRYMKKARQKIFLSK